MIDFCIKHILFVFGASDPKQAFDVALGFKEKRQSRFSNGHVINVLRDLAV